MSKSERNNKEFEMGRQIELNFGATITEIKNPSSERFNLIDNNRKAELKWPLCKYYSSCLNYVLKKRWRDFSCINCNHRGKEEFKEVFEPEKRLSDEIEFPLRFKSNELD